MQKLIFTLIGFFAIAMAVNAQEGGFKPSGSFWGYTFGDYYYVSHADSLGRGAGNVQYKPNSNNSTNSTSIPATATSTSTSTSTTTGGATTTTTTTTVTTVTNTKTNLDGNDILNQQNANAFQLRRVYLGYDFKFTPKVSASAVLANEQNEDASNYNTVYLKYYYLKWGDIFPKSTLIFGQQVTPSFATAYNTEPLMGYRSNERTIMDIHNNDSSTDLGLGLTGNIWESKTSSDTIKPNILGYYLQFGNGNSAKPASNGFKTMRGNLYVSLLDQKLTVGLYGDYRPSITKGEVTSVKTGKIYANYSTEIISIGGEYINQTFMNGCTYNVGTPAVKTYQNDVISGWSVFVKGKIVKQLHYYVRMDQYNPDTKYNSSTIYTVAPSIITPTLTYAGSYYSMGGCYYHRSYFVQTDILHPWIRLSTI